LGDVWLAHNEIDTDASSTWVFLIGFVAALAGALTLLFVMERRASSTSLAALASVTETTAPRSARV
jgi:hypothetical protein